MAVLTASLAIVALVLAVGGALKLADPSPTRDLLAALGGPSATAVPW